MATLQARIEALASTIAAKFNAIKAQLLPAGGAQGLVLTKTGAADYAVGWAAPASAPWALVRKTAAEARTANITLTADSALVVALGTGTYLVRGVALLSTANATMDYKFDLNFTGTATWPAAMRRYMAAGAAAGTDQENSLAQTAVISSTAVAATTTGIARVEFEAVITVTAAGTFQFRWAQNTSDAGALTCLNGSYLEWTAF